MRTKPTNSFGHKTCLVNGGLVYDSFFVRKERIIRKTRIHFALLFCLQALETPDSGTVDEQAKKLHNLIGQLSAANQRVAGLLFHHLQR